jgi:hypothetical protein
MGKPDKILRLLIVAVIFILNGTEIFAQDSKSVPPSAIGDRIAVFREQGFPRGSMPKATTPEFIAKVLKKGGYKVDFLDAKSLSDPGILTPRKYNVLILSYGETVPLDALKTINGFVASGGGLISPAGVPLSRTVRKIDGVWRESKSNVSAIFGKILPLARYYRTGEKIEYTIRTDKEYLPHLPDYWPITGGRLGFVPELMSRGPWKSKDKRYSVSPETQRYLAASVDGSGEIAAFPLWFTMADKVNSRGRFLFMGFEGESNPWNPKLWKYADAAILDMVAIVADKKHLYIANIYTVYQDKPYLPYQYPFPIPPYNPEPDYKKGDIPNVCFYDGDKVKVNAGVYTTVPTEAEVTWVIRPRDGIQAVYREKKKIKLKGGLNALSFTWAPGKFDSFAYDVMLTVKAEGTYTARDYAMFMVGNREIMQSFAARGPEVRPGKDKTILVDGKQPWWTGVNLVTRDLRGGGGFNIQNQIIPRDWDADMSYLKLMGANYVRQGWLRESGPEMFTSSDPKAKEHVKGADAYMLDAAYHRMINSFHTLYYLNTGRWEHIYYPEEIPEELDGKDPYTSPGRIKLQRDWLKGLLHRYAFFKNVTYEILNEPTYLFSSVSHMVKNEQGELRYNRTSKSYEYAQGKFGILLMHNVEKWHNDTVAFMRKAAGRPVVLRNEQGSIDPFFNGKVLREADGNSFHVYSPGRLFRGKHFNYVFQMAYNGPNCMIGEAGVAANNYFMDDLTSLLIGEVGLGYAQFFLYNRIYAPRFGLGRYDETEPPRMRQWRRFNMMTKYLDRGAYLRPQDILLTDIVATAADRNLLNTLADDYLGLLKRGLHTRILILAELKRDKKVHAVILPRQISFPEGTLDYLHGLAQKGVPIYSLDTRRYNAIGWIKKKDPVPELRQREVAVTNPAVYTYVNPKKEGGWTIVLVGGQGKTRVKVKGGPSYSLNIPEKWSAVLDLNKRGELLLAKSFGPVFRNGKELIRAPEGLSYVIASKDGKPLAKSKELAVESDYPSQVEVVGNIPENSIRTLKTIQLIFNTDPAKGLQERLKSSLEEKGIKVKIVDRVSGKVLAGGNILMVGLPKNLVLRKRVEAALAERKIIFNDSPAGGEILLGTSRLLHPWSGVILTMANPWNRKKKLILLKGVDTAGLEVAISRFAVLDLLGNYSVMPWGRLAWVSGS